MSENSDQWLEIRNALEDPRWGFRTISSIAKSTTLSEDEVRRILASHKDQLYQASHLNERGEVLYALEERAPRIREFIGNVQRYVAKTPLYGR